MVRLLSRFDFAARRQTLLRTNPILPVQIIHSAVMRWLYVSASLWVACSSCGGSEVAVQSVNEADELPSRSATVAADAPPDGRTVAIFAGGCFWCMEKPFEHVDGVDTVLSGYAGGAVREPSYAAVSAGDTGHAEAIRVLYDPARVTYEELLAVFWRNVDPTDAGGQFCDRGTQYRTAIFPRGAEQRRLADESRGRIATRLGAEVQTRIEEADVFWIAEAYHQDFYARNTRRYESYRLSCGRDARLQELWGE